MSKGMFISLEGPDGAGKSSVLEALIPILETKGQAQAAFGRAHRTSLEPL